MKTIKKLTFSLVTLGSFIWMWFSAQNFPYTEITVPWENTPVDIDISTIIKEEIINDDLNTPDSKNWLNRILKIFMPNTAMYMWSEWPSILFYLKTIVNLLLSFISLISLILLIFAFYMIFFKKDEAGITTATQIIKWVVIALVVIWLSRIVVSFLFRFENENTQDLWYHNTIQTQLNIW